MQLKFLKKNIKSENLLRGKGIVALPTVILIGGIILEIVLTLSLVSYLLLQSGAGSRFAAEALTAAQAGVDDAIIKIIRNNNTGGTGDPTSYPYTISVDSSGLRTASVWICKGFYINLSDNSCNLGSPTPNQTTVVSLGKAFNKNSRLQAFINIDPVNGEVRIKSIQEITL